MCLGGFRPETRVATGILTGLLLAVHFAARALAPLRLPAHPAGWVLLPFLGYAAANAMWVTPVPWLGWLEWFGWAQTVAVFWVTLNGIRSRTTRKALFAGLCTLAAVAVFMACYQRFARPDWLMLGRVQAPQFLGRSSGPFGIPNSLAAFLLLLLPAAGALTLRTGAAATARIAWGWLTAVLALGLLLTVSRGAWLGLALALIAWPLTSRRWPWRRRAWWATVILALVLAAGVGIYSASPQARERLVAAARDGGELSRPVTWRAAWKLFREAPGWGTGAASYNTLFEKHRPEKFPVEPQWAHNDYLNTLSDYGAAGFLLFFGGAGFIAWRAWRGAPREAGESGGGRRGDWLESPPTLSALGIGLLAFAFQLALDFHFKIPALALSFAAVAGLAVRRAWPLAAAEERARPAARIASGAAALASLGVALAVLRPMHEAEGLRYRARQSLDRVAAATPEPAVARARLEEARDALQRAVAIHPANAQAWADLAYVHILRAGTEPGRNGQLGREAEAAADRALAISGAPFEFWVRRGVARDMQGRWLDAGNDTMQAVLCAPTNPLAWYHHAYHLSLKPTEQKLARAAVAFCLRLDPYNDAGLALRQRLAVSPASP